MVVHVPGRLDTTWTWRLTACLLCLGTAGCGKEQPDQTRPNASFAGVEIEVGVLAPRTNAAEVLDPLTTPIGEWEATRGGKVVSLGSNIESAGKVPAGLEVIVFPAELLGELEAAGAIEHWAVEELRPPRVAAAQGGEVESRAPPPKAENALQFADILPELRDRVIRYGSEVAGLPMGTSALVVVYRRDAFDRVENRAAAKEAGLALEPPITYEELDALARFFQGRDWDGDGDADSGIALAMETDREGVADAAYLARAAALGQHPDYFGFLFDDRTMEPRVDSPPFVEALEGLVGLVKSGPEGMTGFSAVEARSAFREGKVALLIDRAEQSGGWSDAGRPQKVGVAPLPGSTRVYDPGRKAWEEPAGEGAEAEDDKAAGKVAGERRVTPRLNRPTFLLLGGGWMLGVRAGSPAREREASRDFVRFLAGPETSQRLVSDRDFPLLPTRSSQAGVDRTDRRLDIKGWDRAVARTLLADRLVTGPRLPGAIEYMEELSRARTAAVAGGPPAEALAAAAAAWRRITERAGLERQAWFERRSMNLRTTGSKPPAAPGVGASR